MAIASTSSKFVKKGDTIDYTIAAAGTAVSCGKFVKTGGVIGLALWDIPAGTTGSLKVLHKGEIIAVTTDEAIGATNADVAIYIDANGLVTKTATSNTLLGYTKAAIAATDLTFEVVCA